MGCKRFLILLVLILVGKGLSAQSNTMYYLKGVPQRYYTNPASQPQPNVFIGCPVLSSSYLDVRHNSIGLSDIFWSDPESGQVLHPFHPDADLGEFLEKFKDANALTADLDLSLISFGFRVKGLYFMVDATSRFSSSVSFPSELAEFGLLGTEDYNEFNFDDMGFHIREHLELGLGVSYNFGDMITAGVRPKLLFGIASLGSYNNQITLYTSHEEWELDSHIEMHMATPGIFIPVTEEGTLDLSGQFVFDSTLTTLSAYRNAATGNKGFGIDMGIHITPMEELSISVSVIDLGIIKWQNYIHSAQLDGSFEFSGIEIDAGEGLSPTDDSDSSGFGAGMLDSLFGSFNISGGADPFTTRLETKVFVGASYSLLPSLSLGLLARFDIPENGFEYDLMLHANWQPSNIFGLSFNYSPFQGGASTFGFGAFFQLGPFSAYAIADYNTLRFTLYKYQTETMNIPVMLSADNRTAFNLRIGLNLLLGWNQRKRLMQDKPMYFSEDY